MSKHRRKPYTAQLQLVRGVGRNSWVLVRVRKTGVWSSTKAFASKGHSRTEAATK